MNSAKAPFSGGFCFARILFMAKKLFVIIVILILAGGVGYYIWRDLNKNANVRHSVANMANICDESSTSSECVKDEQKISPEPANMPDLDRPIKITANLPVEAIKTATEKIKQLSEELRKNPDLFNEWLVLGIYRKMIGDYEGASEVWEYTAIIRPKSSTPFNNLGDLYGYYIKDNKKAEENFLKALENDPKDISLYRNLYDFYRYVIKNDEKAKDILRKGIEFNSDSSQDLKYLLDNYDSLD